MIILFFSLCDQFSFDSLDDCIRIYSEFGGKNVSNFPTLLIGTNSDEEERKVKSEEAINYAKNIISLDILKYLQKLEKMSMNLLSFW